MPDEEWEKVGVLKKGGGGRGAVRSVTSVYVEKSNDIITDQSLFGQQYLRRNLLKLYRM